MTKKDNPAAGEKTRRAHGGGEAPARCVFDLYDLKFGMKRPDIAAVVEMTADDKLDAGPVEKAGAEWVELFFDQEDRLWQVKARYPMESEQAAEALLERMSRDYRLQTPSTMVVFEMNEYEGGGLFLYIRYTEVNLKRMYLRHMMNIGAAKMAQEEEERARREREEEEYIPSGPLIF